jgi:hypothetical protein
MNIATALEDALRLHVRFTKFAADDVKFRHACASREEPIEHYTAPISELIFVYQEARCALKAIQAAESRTAIPGNEGGLNPEVSEAGAVAASAWARALELISNYVSEASDANSDFKLIRDGQYASTTLNSVLMIKQRTGSARKAARALASRAPLGGGDKHRDGDNSFLRSVAALARRWLLLSSHVDAIGRSVSKGANLLRDVTSSKDEIAQAVRVMRVQEVARATGENDTQHVEPQHIESDDVESMRRELNSLAFSCGCALAEADFEAKLLALRTEADAMIDSLARETSKQLAALPEQVAAAASLSREEAGAKAAQDVAAAKRRLLASAGRLEIVAAWVRLVRLLQRRSAVTRSAAIGAANTALAASRPTRGVLNSLVALGAEAKMTRHPAAQASAAAAAADTVSILVSERKLQRDVLVRVLKTCTYSSSRHNALEELLRALLDRSLRAGRQRAISEASAHEAAAAEL